MQQLLEVITAFESAYRGGDGAAAAAAQEFEAVLAGAVDPLVEMCERSAEAIKPGAPSRHVYHNVPSLLRRHTRAQSRGDGARRSITVRVSQFRVLAQTWAG